MSIKKLCILGAGNLFLGANLFAAVACYFGERPLEVRFHDDHNEFLNLNFELAYLLHKLNRSSHQLLYTPDLQEAIDNVDGVIVMQQLPKPFSSELNTSLIWPASMNFIKEGVPILCIGADGPAHCRSMSLWPERLESEWTGFQILRWIRGEEYPYELIQNNQDSPILRWLTEPNVTEL